jgi:hypothetical protein
MVELVPVPPPWRRPVATGSDARVQAVHVTDPLCPWAYSADPTLRFLEARSGEQLLVRTVLIGLVSNALDSPEVIAGGLTGGRTCPGRHPDARRAVRRTRTP